jgi:hypothetical protein
LSPVTPGKNGASTGYNNEPDLSNPDASGPLRFIVVGCDSMGTGATCPSATITIQRFLRPDRTGIWSVVRVEDRGIASGASPSG